MGSGSTDGELTGRELFMASLGAKKERPGKRNKESPLGGGHR